MPSERMSHWWYPFAAAGAALLLCMGLGPWIGPNIFAPFLTAVLLCTYFGGTGAGLTATILSSALCTGLLIGDRSLALTPITIAMRVLLFAGVELLMVLLTVRDTRTAETLRKLSRAIEQSPVAVVVTDARGLIEYVNPRFTGMSGYSFDEVRGRNPRLLKSGETAPEEYQRLWQTITAGEVWRGELHNRRKDGRLYWESISISPVFDEQGVVTHFVAVQEDITERKWADQEIHAREQQLRATFEQAAVGIAHVGLDGRWIRLNRRYCDILGYTENELLSRSYQDTTHPEDLDADLASDRRFLEGESFPYSAEKRYVRKDGSPVWTNLTVSLVRDRDGKPSYFIAIVEDISDRKRAEEATRESERRFRAMAETVPCLVWVARPDGWTTYLNGQWRETTGATQEGSVGWGWAEWLHPEDRERSSALWEACVSAGTVFEIEQRIRCANGGYRWFLSRAVPRRDDTGKIVEWFGTCTDIEDQKQTQAALIEATQAKDRFLAVLSHELRAPLTPVLLAVTAMQQNEKTGFEPGSTLEMMRANLELEARLIEDLLDVSRIARGEMTYRFETVDLHSLIDRALEICDAELRLKRHHLVVNLAATEHHVHGDPARLQQVLWNLLNNAVKYTPDGGHISVRSRTVDHERIRIEVVDDGVGIQPVDLSRVFKVFERGYGATAFHASGLGLGLAICRLIAEAHHGTLTGASQGRHKGSTFTLDLATVSAPSIRTDPDVQPNGSRQRSLRILLAEDNTASAQVITDVLRSRGHMVTLATSLRMAIDAVSVTFDLVISDIDLGDGSGLELMRHVRTLGATPGIALSGYATIDDIRESLDAGFAIHLAKPVTLDTLESAIHDVVSQRTRLL